MDCYYKPAKAWLLEMEKKKKERQQPAVQQVVFTSKQKWIIVGQDSQHNHL